MTIRHHWCRSQMKQPSPSIRILAGILVFGYQLRSLPWVYGGSEAWQELELAAIRLPETQCFGTIGAYGTSLQDSFKASL